MQTSSNFPLDRSTQREHVKAAGNLAKPKTAQLYSERRQKSTVAASNNSNGIVKKENESKENAKDCYFNNGNTPSNFED